MPAPSLAEAQLRYREAAAAAIEELVSASNESVERLAAGLVRVQEIGEQVQVLANRATLIALNVALSGSGATGPRPEGWSRDLRSLAAEVRSVTDLTAGRFIAIDREVAAAVERMKGLRERVAAKLDAAPPLPEAGAAAPRVAPQPTEVALRLLERVREMVQDAAAKGERLSAAGERASRAAERLVRRLEEEAGTLEGLAMRLGATAEELREGGVERGAAAPPRGGRPAAARAGPREAPAGAVRPGHRARGRRRGGAAMTHADDRADARDLALGLVGALAPVLSDVATPDAVGARAKPRRSSASTVSSACSRPALRTRGRPGPPSWRPRSSACGGSPRAPSRRAASGPSARRTASWRAWRTRSPRCSGALRGARARATRGRSPR